MITLAVAVATAIWDLAAWAAIAYTAVLTFRTPGSQLRHGRWSKATRTAAAIWLNLHIGPAAIPLGALWILTHQPPRRDDPVGEVAGVPFTPTGRR